MAAHLDSPFPVKAKLKPNNRRKVGGRSSTPESKYWRSFKAQQIPNLISAVSSIDFSAAPPHDFAATFSASLTIFSSDTFLPKTTISSFSDVAFSAAFRSDGSLIAAGGQSGLVQVFDVNKRTSLRQLRSHSRPVRLVRYPRFDRLHLFSGGDDALVKYWDVAAGTQISELVAHRDYVRCGSASPATSDLFATGSYDHTVRLWDVRVSDSGSSMVVNHGKPVESVAFLPSGGLIATAGGNSVKIWDVIGGGRLVHAMESHTKTVTSICVGKIGKDTGGLSQQYRLLSVGLDGYMKVFDFSEMKVTHSMKFPAPLLSIGFSPDCSNRAIGTSNGIIFGGKRKKKAVKAEDSKLRDFAGFGLVEEPKRLALRPTNFRYFLRGQGEKPSEEDYLVLKPPKVKLAEHDKLLNKFMHKEALVSALNGKDPGNVVPLMEELVARKKLLMCVMNLDKEELGLLLRFLSKHLTAPRYSSILMGLAKEVLERRGEEIRADSALKGHVRNLKRAIDEEIRIQQALQEIQGIVSPLLRIAGRR